VVDTASVAADGTYIFPNVPKANGYSVQINNVVGTLGSPAPVVVLPGGYVSTGENNGTGTGSDGTINGTSATFNVTGSEITNINFGIELPPAVGFSSQPAVLNPNGTTDYSIPNTLFEGADFDGGIIDSIKIVGFPANVDEITINGISYTSASFPAGGVFTPTNAIGNPTTPILIDPIDGTVTVDIVYQAVDNAGVLSPIPGYASLQFLEPIGIVGTVFNDKDRSATGNDNSIQTGTEIGTNTGLQPIFVYLVDPVSGLIVGKDEVDADGNYAFGGITANTDVKLVLSTADSAIGAIAPASILPTGWNATSKLDTTFNVGSPIPAIITNLNFGIIFSPDVNPDMNQTWVNVPVAGNVSTNDEGLPIGTTYVNPAPNLANPGTALPTINADGTYTFISSVPGVFNFQVPAVTPNGDTILVDLVITVLDETDANVKPVANVDLATTPLNTAVTLNTLSNGTTTVDGAGNITYTPNAGFSGKDTLTYTVVDDNGNTVAAQQIITVLPAGANNTTTATDDYKSGPYNTPVSGNAITNDKDAEGDVQAIVPQTTTIAGKGTLTLNADGTYTFVPVAGFSGPVEFPYSVYDNDATSPDSAKATIHILVASEVPVPNPDVNATWAGVPVTGDVSTNDKVPSGSTYGNPPANAGNPGTAVPTITADGTYTFTSPVAGVFTFKVPVIYPNGDTDSVDLIITVLDSTSNANPPIANTDLASTAVNVPVTISTLSNDATTNVGIDVGLDPSTVTVIEPPVNGTTSVDPVTGDITYTPNVGFVGVDTLKYSVTDSLGNIVTAIQIITVLDTTVNPNSTSASDNFNSVTSTEPVVGNVLTNDTDAEGDTQTVTPQTVTIPGKGTLDLTSDGSYTFTPAAGYVGPIDFPYEVVDARGATAEATIHVLVEATNTPLAITFTSFNVSSNNCMVNLNWSVANASDLKQFDIYESKNGIDFIIVKSIQATTALKYQAITQSAVNTNTSYYFIQGIEKDGSASKTVVNQVQTECNKINIVSYPNPVSNNLSIAIYNVTNNANAIVIMRDAFGNIVTRIQAEVNANTDNIITIDASRFASGVYTLDVVVEGMESKVISITKN
jgi:hypothetical protein